MTKHQKFEYRQVHRSLIQPAAYNPNVMDPEAYKLLEEGKNYGKVVVKIA